MPRLEIRDIVMQFPAVRALDGVTITFDEGEVHGIIGENGAGKSTLMRILAGLQKPTDGQLLLDGEPLDLSGVAAALGAGIAMIHQELNLVDSLSAAENIFLGREVRRGLLWLDKKSMNAVAKTLLERVGASFEPTVEVASLSIAGKQLVEIAKALSYEARILIMDEPTAVLSDREAASLFELIRELKSKGVTVLYISHRLGEIEAICDRVSVLRDGLLIETVPAQTLSQEQMANLMVGRPLGDMFPDRRPSDSSASLLEVEDLSDEAVVKGVTFAIGKGEIVGMAGLIGSGRTEVAEMIVGARRATNGSVRIGEFVGLPRNPKHAAQLGLAYVSEDRKDTGLVLSMSVIQNTTLANLDRYAKPVLKPAEERAATEAWKARLDIRAHDLDAAVLFLSGGNQQKVSIAKWLELSPSVLILDEPTRGVDVGAKREIYNLIHGLAADGMACLVISSELPELLGLCHRILVMREGLLVGEVAAAASSEREIMLMATGVAAA